MKTANRMIFFNRSLTYLSFLLHQFFCVCLTIQFFLLFILQIFYHKNMLQILKICSRFNLQDIKTA